MNSFLRRSRRTKSNPILSSKSLNVFLLALLLALSLVGSAAQAQVDVTATAGNPGPVTYGTLKLAFDAINAGTHQGSVTVSITASTTEGTTPATLNSSGAGAAVYTTVLIRPTADGVSVSGNPAAGFGVIQLNGADNVTIDGDNPGTGGINRNLTVANTALATINFGSAIRIATSAAVTSADNDTIRNCILTGNVTSGNAAAITGATTPTNQSFGFYAGGNGGATAVGAPTALTSVTTNTAPGTTTINNLIVTNNAVSATGRAIVFNGAATTVSNGVTVTSNVIGDPSAPSPATPPYTSPATTVYTKGVWVAGTNAVTITGNTINDVISYINLASITAIELVTPIGATAVINDNIVTNVAENGASGSVKAILVGASTGAYTVAGNTVTNVQSMAGTSGSAGMEVNGGPTSAVIERNKITTVNNRNIGTFGATGMNLVAGNNIVVRNNFISDITMDMTGGAAFSTTFSIYGLKIVAGTGDKIYNNSINLFGLMAGAPATNIMTAALTVVAAASSGMDIRDNALSNTISGGTTGIAHVAIFLPAAATSAMGLTENNNGYYFGTDAARQGVGQAGTTPGTNFFTSLALLRSYSGTLSVAATNDNSSHASTTAAPFVSATDLHIPAATATQLESAGAPVGVTADIDGDPRSGTTPDIGADEFSGTIVDLTSPSITYTPFLNTTLTTNRTLVATVTDLSGVPTAGVGRPVIYFRKGAVDPYVSSTCTFVSGNNYNCVINYALVTGGSVTAGDVIQYYVAAQDNLGNVTTQPFAGASGFTANPPAAATPPTTPSTYNISTAITGSVSVGTGGTFASLTNAGGLFQSINNNVVTGNVVVDILNDLVGETGVIALNQWAEDGVGGYTVTIRPTGAPRSITGTSATAVPRALIRLNGADRVILDGSTSGGTDRSLTITNTDTSAASAVIHVASGPNGSQNITLKNLVVFGNNNTQTFVGISFGGAAIASLGSDNDNERVENCDVRRVQYGIVTQGASTANKDTGTVFTRNSLITAGADSVGKGAILASFEDGIQITENSIDGIVFTGSTDVFGISLGGLIGWANTVVTGGSEVTNAIVARNKIGVVRQSNTFSAAGIVVTPATTGTNLIANNFLTGVQANGTSGDFGAGIFIIENGTDSTTQVYGNSVSMTGTLASGDQGQYALAVNGADPLIDIRDNILVNTQVTGAANISYAIGLGYSTFVNLTSNFNDLLVTTPGNFRIGRTVALAPAGGTDLLALANWQTATGTDANSLSVDPLFTSTTDLHLQLGSPMLNAGTGLASLTNDIDNDPRPAASPDIGADEIVQFDLSITKTDGVTTAVPGSTVTYTIAATNAGPDGVAAATIADTFPASLSCSTTCLGTGGATCIAGPYATNINETLNLPSLGTVTYTSVCTIAASATGTLANTATVSATVADPTPGNNTATDTDTLTPQADLGITKTDGVTTAVPGTSVTYTIVASNPGPSNAPGSTVADVFPAALSCSTTCIGAGGGTCPAGPVVTNINNVVNLPAGSSVTYTSVCAVNASTPAGSLVNTATVTAPGGVTDSNPGNDSATDTDTLSPQANLGITKTDGVTIAPAGGNVTYTITASNAGPSNAPGSTVADTFAAVLSCSTTCVGAGGGTCTAGPIVTNINDVVNLPSGASVTYTAVCAVNAGASGTLVNTATVSVAGGITDPTPGNNSATDTDTIGLQADLSITKTDGVTQASPGTNTTYTIVASNSGPSAAPTAAVVDNFPPACTSVSWTCSGSGGGTCTASGSGNINQSVSLPTGGSVTFVGVCAISGSATGTLSNTATIGVGANDPNTANNSATDVDSLSNEIFIDGFESGDTSEWSSVVPLTFSVYATVGAGPGASGFTFDYDFAAVQSGEALAATSIAFGTDAAGKPLFLIAARRTEANGQLELTLEVVGGARSSWVPAGEVGQQVRIEWSGADQSNLGHVAVSLDERLALWVEGFASTSAPANVLLLRGTAPATE